MKTFEIILTEGEFNTLLPISHFQLYGGFEPIFCAKFNLSAAWFVKLCNNKIFGNIWDNHPHGELEIIKIFDHRGIL